jgi:general secretion pathway protein L
MTSAVRLHAGAVLFGQWWLQQWQASLPETLRSACRRQRPHLAIAPGDDEVVISLVSADGNSQVVERRLWTEYRPDIIERCRRKAARGARRYDLVLIIAPPYAVRHTLMIPRQARSEAQRIVHEHVLRKTPLTGGEFLVTHQLTPAGKDKLALHFLVVARRIMAERLSRLGLGMADVAGIQEPSSEGQPSIRIALSQPSRARLLTIPRAILCLFAITLVCSLTGYGGLVWRQQVLLDKLEAQAAEAATPSGRAMSRARSVAELARDIQRANELRQMPGAVRVWEELARLLPATTYLTEINMQSAEVQLKGFSADAAALIQLFEASPILSDAGFLAPVLVDRATGKEQFALRATLRKPRLPFAGSS